MKQLLASQSGLWTFVLWVLVALAIALGSILGEEAAPMAWAKVWGGPTEGPTPLNLRIELVQPLPIHDPSHARVELRVESEARKPVVLPLSFDDQNTAHVRLAKPLDHPHISVLRGKQRLASGAIRLDRDRFWQKRRVREGWLLGRSEGVWTIRAGCREGAFALGRGGLLGIVVTDGDGQPVHAELSLEFEGLESDRTASTPPRAPLDPAKRDAGWRRELQPPLAIPRQGSSAPLVAPLRVATDERGHASISLVPRDLSASLRIRAFQAERPMADYFAAVPIASSALVASSSSGKILVDSWLPVPRIYYALVNDQGLWASGGIARDCAGTNPCRLELGLGELPSAPAWLMLGSEASLDGPNVIGWPVLVPSSTFVPDTVVVRDQLLIDGKAEVQAQAATQRRAQFQFVLFGLGFAAVVLATACIGPMLRARSKETNLLTRLAEADSPRVVPRRLPSTAFLLLLIGFGLVALLFWIRARILGP